MFLLYLMFRVKFSQEGGSVASLMDKKHASNTTRLYCVSYFIHFLPLIKRKAVLSKLLHTITDKPFVFGLLLSACGGGAVERSADSKTKLSNIYARFI